MADSFLSNGVHYDAYHASHDRDLAFWIRRARQCSEPMLELAVGTGRVAIPVAASGIPVVGIDISDVFLEHARTKAADKGLKLELYRHDMRSFSLQRRFGLVALPFRAVATLLNLDDLCATLSCAREHILPEGELIIDTWNTPDLTYSRQSEQRGHYNLPDGRRVEFISRSQYDAASRITEAKVTFLRPPLPLQTESLCLRHHTRAELKAALEEAGFRVTAWLGDYEEGPLSGTSTTQIITARLAGPS